MLRSKPFLPGISSTFSLLGFFLAVCSGISHAAEITAKFAPPAGKVLVFVGQDNDSVGGTAQHKNGYVDNIGVPAGITHYVYLVEGWTNAFGYTFKKNRVDGLDTETNWGGGPKNLKAYLDSPTIKDCVIHLSISMEGNSEDRVADGSYDHLVDQLVAFMKAYPQYAFLLRIGYEFDGKWNDYDPQNFKAAFRRIVDKLRANELQNFATVMASSGQEEPSAWDTYWPGNDYVDWIGYSYFKAGNGKVALSVARAKGKPVFVAESTPRGYFLEKTDGQEAWAGWYQEYFDQIERNLDVIRAISYINCNWDAQPMWDNWGNTRLEENAYVRQMWLQKMSQPTYINAVDQPYRIIGTDG